MTQATQPQGMLARWNRIPLYLRIVIAMGLGVVCGLALGLIEPSAKREAIAGVLGVVSTAILQLLGALAPPLILVAVTHVLMTTDIKGRSARRLAGLLLLNTTVAIFIGLTVANLMKPGARLKSESEPSDPTAEATAPENEEPSKDATEPAVAADHRHSAGELLVSNLPRSIFGPLGDKTNIIGVIIIAIAFGLALRDLRSKQLGTIEDLVEIAYDVLLKVLHWVIYLIPIGVFAIVTKVVGTSGFAVFRDLAAFVVAVLIALSLQTIWYLIRIRLGSKFNPFKVLKGVRDAMVMAFSTDSSTVTMPVTYACLKEQVGVDEEAASMGALVGANFNNDGTALYEAMAALFVAQMVGMDLSLGAQLTVVFTSIIASVGAAGIPEAGLVTMTLVFTAVGLPVEHISLLLTVDWFLDRCRTTINVLGDVNVSCLLHGRIKPEAST